MRRRVLAVGLLALCAAVSLLVVSAGSALTPASACNEGGKSFCVNVTKSDNVSLSTDSVAYLEIDVSMTSRETSSTLTHPTAMVTLGPDCYASTPLSGTETCGSQTAPTTAVFLFSVPSGCTQDASTGTVTCRFANIPAGGTSSVYQLFYSTPTLANVPSGTTVFASEVAFEGSVDEHTNDNGTSDPQQDTALGATTISYEPIANQAVSIVPPARPVKLAPDQISAVFFRSKAGSAPATATLAVEPFAAANCFGGLTCFDLQRETSLGIPSSSLDGTILWRLRLLGTTSTNFSLVHRYDPLSVTASAATDAFTSTVSYANVDGVKLSGATGLGLADGDYYVVGASTSAPFTFKVSPTKGGAPVDVTADGGASAARIRIIGDQRSELFNPGSTSCESATPSATPVMFAAKVKGLQAVDVCLWDSANGLVGPGR